DPDWVRWFDPQTLGFALTELQPARPEWAPPCACDRQAAWTGALPDRPDRPVRVEAAAYRGHPVYFEIMPARREADQADRRPDGRARPADRPGPRGRGAARPPRGLVDRGVGRRPAAAPHGGRAVCARTPRAADAALRPARLPARPDHHPRPVPGVVLRTFPG